MFRITKAGNKYYAVSDVDLTNENTQDDILQLVESGDAVILVDDVADVEVFGIDHSLVEQVD